MRTVETRVVFRKHACMVDLDDKAQRRLSHIAKKGWEVAERLASLKSKQDFELSDIIDPTLEFSNSREERLRKYLDMIERARARLLANNESYGRCLGCAAVFSDAVLDEQPWIEFCGDCHAVSQTDRS